MKFRTPLPATVLSTGAIVLALGGGSYAAASGFVSDSHIKKVVAHSTAGNSNKLNGHGPNYYLPSRQLGTSHGDRFLNVGQTVVLGKTGHFTFIARCLNPSGTTGAQQVDFQVKADVVADLDGGGPVTAGTVVNIHSDSDALNTSTATPLNPGDFTQVGSASSSTEIASTGQEVDVFYNDGVNWPAVGGASAHQCFAGYTGLLG